MDESLEKKVFALPGGKEFKETVDRMSVKDLEARIMQGQKDLDESEEHRKNNRSLQDAKGKVKELSGPYNDFKKAINVKTKYIIELIKEKGGA